MMCRRMNAKDGVKNERTEGLRNTEDELVPIKEKFLKNRFYIEIYIGFLPNVLK
jgi:hypothetical protein